MMGVRTIRDGYNLDIVSEDMGLGHDAVTYKFEKREFIVQPEYKADSDKTINDMLMNLMKKDSETHY